ncbi:hypothetical protein UPYG_G00244570 [Umbra pygmaea]|uniref:Uncharacterized protein n=1 Tax=Umbra pygmaea TaxID=75934 RepID=A0ABD0WHN8_UMBPY
MSHYEEVKEIYPASKMSLSEEVKEIDPASKMSHSEEVKEIDPTSKMSHSEEVKEIDPASKMSHSEEVKEIDPASKISLSEEVKEIDPASKMSHSEEVKEIDPASKVCLSEEVKKIDPASKMSHTGHHDTKAKSSIHQERPASSVPSCVSMKSDHSMGQPIYFREGDFSSEQRDKQKKPESNIIHDQSVQSHQTDLSSIFNLLEQNIMTFIKKELKRFKTKLSSDLPECFEGQRKDEEVVDSEDGKQESSAKEGALKITLHFLRNMNQEKLADALEESELSTCQSELKSNLRKKYQCVFEGLAKQGNPTLLNEIYTELYITEGGSGDVNNEHEVRQIERTTRKQARPETAIKCNDIFKPLPGHDKPIRTVLTKGVAGIGKTVSVQKFILDWAEGKSNQDIQFMFSLPFRELNLIKEKHSLIKLLKRFSIESRIFNNEKYKVVLIFDGLDECRLPLDFTNNQCACDVTESTSVDILLTNLIKGNLLPSALVWITSRPAAANQIPSGCVDRVTEVRGFNDPQKEGYFRRRFSDQDLASRIISHVKTSRSLHIMCHIPVFCWISAVVLEHMISTEKRKVLPTTLTEMYTHLVIYHMKQMNEKYPGKEETDPTWNKESILTLGKLAFQQLEKGNQIFYEEDLKECGLDINEASVYSGVCTQIFREECGLYQDKVYCFVHLSIQEFLAAVYLFLLFTNNNKKRIVKPQSTSSILSELHRENPEVTFYKSAVDEALQSKTGHLDLFLRFLLGLSLESNQKHLQRLLTKTRSSSQSHEETVNYIKEKIRENPSSERCINLFHCLNELNDRSLVEEIQRYLRSGCLTREKLSPAQWSALVFVLLTSVKEIDVFDLKKYSTSEEGLLRMMPVVKTCRAALLSGCGITEKGCAALVSALRSNPSSLKELDLSNNDLKDSGVKMISALLEDPQCRLETLRLSGCLVTEEGCASLVSALRSNPSHLKELDLSYNHPGDSGVTLLSAGLEDPTWRLEKLNMDHGGECWLKSGLKKYICDLTLDPNTANRYLCLSEENRKVTLGSEKQPFPDHSERFEDYKQVLCREGLTGRCYWEVEWSGVGTKIAVTYKGINRRGVGDDCKVGNNDKSWRLFCDANSYSACHNNKTTDIPVTPSGSYRVGVYLDWPAGTLSFYRVSSDTLTHLYTFNTTFTEPLYPGFAIYINSSVSLCQLYSWPCLPEHNIASCPINF